MYKYETHLHTSPVSACASATVRESLEFYKGLGYDGVFITNHFLDGNILNIGEKSYAEKLDFFFSDYEEGVKIGKEIGIKVFCGVEQSYGGTDFLIYGADKEWFLKNPVTGNMTKKDELARLMESGALVIHAHPFREAGYIDHIRLYPRHVHGVEIINACRTELENKMAGIYAENYGLLTFAGSDNHCGAGQKKLAGMCCEAPLTDVTDFVRRVKNGEMKVFTEENEKA